MSPKIEKPISRRDFLKLGAAGGGALAASNLVMWLSGCTSGGGGEPTTLNVLTPAAPDPAPPGVAEFSMDAFTQWQEDNNAKVDYESPPWPQLHDKMATNFASGQHVHDCMYNCGWVPEFAEYLRANPDTDNGLHLTLTSELKNYRWVPLAGGAAVPGLVDDEGCLWPNVGEVVRNGSPDEVEMEIRAQVARAEKMGIPITHLDSHMGTLFATPQFFERYMKVGIEKNLPIMIMGGHMQFIRQQNPIAVKQFEALKVAEQVWAAGLPVLDDLHNMTYGWRDYDEKKEKLIADLRRMKPGVTMVIVHCTDP